MLAFEADELHRIVDLMRHLRGSETRRHVREEVPFYTGAPARRRRAGRRACPDVAAQRGLRLVAGSRVRLIELMQ